MKASQPGRPTRWLNALEDTVLTILVMGLVVLGGLQIVLRNGFDSGLLWIDPLLRVSVLWLGLIGAVAAARRNKNIRIDLLTRYVPESLARVMDLVTALFASAVCALVAWHGYRMVMVESEFGDTGVLDIPIWVLQSVIPASFGIMAAVYLVAGFVQLFTGRKQA